MIQIDDKPEQTIKHKLIDNSIKQTDCYSISFNQKSSIMVSACQTDIKIWKFAEGKIKEDQTLKGHHSFIYCIIYSKYCDAFLSGSQDCTIRLWKLVQQNEWKSSQPYLEHRNTITCLALNQSENEMVSGSSDNTIVVWKINFIQNELSYLYKLEKHQGTVRALDYNFSSNILVSCGRDKSIIVWQKDQEEKWQFHQIVNNKIEDEGMKIKFLKDDQFIWVPQDHKYDFISVFENQNNHFVEIENKKINLIKNEQCNDYWYFPVFHIKERNLIVVRHKFHLYIIGERKNGYFHILDSINCKTWSIYGSLTVNGSYLVYWDNINNSFSVYELIINNF
ncbi:unnamed protein product [Paramecium octaurelia]|uniref:Uncharacterized protein n=1 Tax=Paramecium octaurelia TaxID=43137 RepID=A0A8S1U1B5_PAROT|nr:unnamed protein product [Paramecium octaurelia]